MLGIAIAQCHAYKRNEASDKQPHWTFLGRKQQLQEQEWLREKDKAQGVWGHLQGQASSHAKEENGYLPTSCSASPGTLGCTLGFTLFFSVSLQHWDFPSHLQELHLFFPRPTSSKLLVILILFLPLCIPSLPSRHHRYQAETGFAAVKDKTPPHSAFLPHIPSSWGLLHSPAHCTPRCSRCCSSSSRNTWTCSTWGRGQGVCCVSLPGSCAGTWSGCSAMPSYGTQTHGMERHRLCQEKPGEVKHPYV